MDLNSQAFFAFVTERESIRRRKLADAECQRLGEIPQGPPWTDDPILQAYKFTNVHRHHDRTSAILREEFYGPHFRDSMANILMNAAIFRYFGTYEFARAIGWSDTYDVDWEHIKNLAKIRLARGERVFTGAYVITNGGISAPKQEVVVDYYLKPLHTWIANVCQIAGDTQSWEETARWMMRNLLGFGGTGFMTKEILLDTTYTGFWDHVVEDPNDGTFSFPEDWEYWTPVGPGARRGAARLLGYDFEKPGFGVSAQESRNVIACLMKNYKQYYTLSLLAPHDIQFQLCEFDKYERVRLNQGRPRSRYKGGTP